MEHRFTFLWNTGF